MRERKISAEWCTLEDLENAEDVMDGFAHADHALERLCELCDLNPAEQRTTGDDWAARIRFDGTEVLARSEGDRWGVWAPPGTDDADAMAAARDLHGVLGALSEGWDLDR